MLQPCFFHRVRGLAAYVEEHVGVGVEGYGDRGMAEEFLDELRMHILLEQ